MRPDTPFRGSVGVLPIVCSLFEEPTGGDTSPSIDQRGSVECWNFNEIQRHLPI